MLDSAKRHLKEVAGLTAINLKHHGDTYLHYIEDGQTGNHVLSHNFVCTRWSGTLKSAKSEPIWMTADELNADETVLPGTVEILKLIASGEFFHENLRFTIN